MSIQTDTVPAYAGEKRAYGFDYQDFPEVQAGETISAPVVPAVTGLTIGAPAVNTAVFDPGGGRKKIPIGKGVVVTLLPAAAGNYDLVCRVDFSGGAEDVEMNGVLAVE